MKTFKLFCEDAASDYQRGMVAYNSSPQQRLSARREDARNRSQTSASTFQQNSLERMNATKDKFKRMRQDYEERKSQKEELQVEQSPSMDSNEYNKQVAKRQAAQKSAHIKHVHTEIGNEAREQRAQKHREMKAIMQR